jgi:hypothetical protein
MPCTCNLQLDPRAYVCIIAPPKLSALHAKLEWLAPTSSRAPVKCKTPPIGWHSLLDVVCRLTNRREPDGLLLFCFTRSDSSIAIAYFYPPDGETSTLQAIHQVRLAELPALCHLFSFCQYPKWDFCQQTFRILEEIFNSLVAMYDVGRKLGEWTLRCNCLLVYLCQPCRVPSPLPVADAPFTSFSASSRDATSPHGTR